MNTDDLLKLDKTTLLSLVASVAEKVRNAPDKNKHKALRETLLKACDLAGIPKATESK